MSSGIVETGERHNGALTVQIIKSTTPATALELNRAGDVRYGWRVKQSEFKNYVIGEWTYFWHHPNGKCYGQAGWVPDPPEDFVSGTKTSTPAADAADPKDGVFGATGTDSGSGGSSGSGDTGDGGGSSSPGESDHMEVTSTTEASEFGQQILNPANQLGRVNWRELKQ
jgi:hypothetical protein